MLKRLAIFGLLLSCASGAWSQIPRNGSQQQQPTQTKDGESQPMTQPCVCTVKVENAPTKQASESEQKPSHYPWRELAAPANIPNWLLVAVGVFAGWLALRTLKAIKRQADLMERQDRTAREKQRARLSVVFPPDPPETLSVHLDNAELMEPSVEVVKDGESNAYDVEASGYVTITRSSKDILPPRAGAPLQIPSVIRDAPPDKPVRVCLAPSGFGTLVGIPVEDMRRVRHGEAFLHIVGKVSYRDVFGDPHETAFHYVWQDLDDESMYDPSNTTVGYWTNMGGEAT